MILLPAHNAIYISHQRCASHTMFEVLKREFGGYHCKSDSYHGRAIPPACASWFKFTTVRNPYSLAVSIWRATTVEDSEYSSKWKFHQLAGDRSFEGFVRVLADLKWASDEFATLRIDPTRISMPQEQWLRQPDGELGSIPLALKIERLDSEVYRLPFWRSSATIRYASNRTDQRAPSWRTHYKDTANVAHIQQWAGDDFKIFYYDKMSYLLQ